MRTSRKISHQKIKKKKKTRKSQRKPKMLRSNAKIQRLRRKKEKRRNRSLVRRLGCLSRNQMSKKGLNSPRVS
jgi:hypothetical protein